MNEIWKSLNGLVEFGEYYEVSNLGNVRSIDRQVSNGVSTRTVKGKMLNPFSDKDGYLSIQFYEKQKSKGYRVHRLVAMAFIENADNKPVVNHKDGNKSNNVVTNLEWTTNSENTIHAIKNELLVHEKGEKHPNATLTDKKVIELFDLYKTNKYSMNQLAEMFDSSLSVVSNIINRKAWKHLDLGGKVTRDKSELLVTNNVKLKEQVIDLFKKGLSLRKIEEQLTISRTPIRKILVEAGLMKAR